MTRLLIVLLSVSISCSASALECIGMNQWEEPSLSGVQSLEEQILLQVVLDDSATLQMEADLGDTHFFIQGNKKSHVYRMMITMGPDYTQGVVNVVTWDQKSEMRLTQVDGSRVFKLECKPLSF